MTERRFLLMGVAGFVLVVVLGLVAGEIGGVTIRSASRTHRVQQLDVSTSVLVPGLPVCLSVAHVSAAGTVLVLRGGAATVSVPTWADHVCAGYLMARIPCVPLRAAAVHRVRLHLLDAERGAVLASSRPLTLLAPGPDCVLESNR